MGELGGRPSCIKAEALKSNDLPLAEFAWRAAFFCCLPNEAGKIDVRRETR
ncbi:hypothetical protein TGS27_1897 [Geobacillus stearothermophilus]|uniref:Uncharacterized protein n=1 Tax=Geobacillus stearothermophilus TaxID=1422 RepID=A0A150MKM2_GEOSE|nr:hypothetical protein GS8_2962 [Geobacillus stearothermophilus]KYD25013.1 hypothetical protein B4109_0415 [Geobacillus stearothermophilus]OAO80489.1 hypothetical protein TGS27_1897 [Geobacillus stearothermophilus]